MVDGKPVFVCCPAYEKPATDNPGQTFKKLEQMKSPRPARGHPATPASPGMKSDDASSTSAESAKSPKQEKIARTLAKLSPEDRAAAEKQKLCVVMKKSELGSMGVPIKLINDGKLVFLCCEGCVHAALKKWPTAKVAEASAETQEQ